MTETVTVLLAILVVASHLFLAGMGLLFGAARLSARAQVGWGAVVDALGPVSLWMAWGVAAVATAGSLYFSEGAHYIPCELCWYQRIAVYPMVLILGISALRRDTSIAIYAAPLALAGVVISVYHYQLQRIPSQASQFCDPLNPCSLTWVWKFHYVSIPMMALTAGMLVALLVTLSHVATRGERSTEANAIGN